MPYLVFNRNNQPVMRHELKGQSISIGRDASCDIQLLDGDISRIHCSIAPSEGAYTLTDMSTNGTSVNDKRADKHKLLPKDVITIGDWKITFHSGAGSASQRETVVRDIAPTKILKYEAKKNELVTESLELTVIMPDGEKKKYCLAAAAIGASSNNDIIINNDPYVSGNHCSIKAENDAFILEDLGSKNSTLLDGKSISRAQLPQKGELTVGKTKITFSIKRSTEKLEPTATTSLGQIVGQSKKMQELFSLVSRIAPSDATACIIGESGTGKELFARYIHESSPRHAKPFVALNCGAIPANLIESEFFGHERGAFTSATSQHKGVFEQADGGTLFLDEIGEMPSDLQTRLLRVLETKQLKRVGGQSDVPVSVRIIAATNKDLKNLVKESKFREDLFFRLYIIPIFIPPLRERKEDLELLTEHFLNELSVDKEAEKLTSEAMNKLLAYDWPGNVRELKNTIQRALLVSNSSSIEVSDIIFSDLSVSPVINKDLPLDDIERQSVLSALARSNGNVSEAARLLGIARTTLTSMAQRFNINLDDYRKQ